MKPPLALYVHLPWCEQKCPYCDFNSHSLKGDLPDGLYIDQVLMDLESTASLRGSRKFETVFFGGGTPSLFAPPEVGRIIQYLNDTSALEQNAEITLEANPGSADAARFEGYRRYGVNRLSLGVQSFNDESLRSLGRIHDGKQAATACEIAKQSGFDNFNIDLMFGLPGQNKQSALSDLESALSQEPKHLSLYQLTIEPNTPFAATPPVLPDEEASWTIRSAVQSDAQQAGFEHYEVSGFARSGYQCAHNLNYWQFGDYIGVGAGAHSKITIENAVYRWFRTRHPKHYMNPTAPQRTPQIGDPINQQDLLFEFLLNALRLKAGFRFELFETRTGLQWSSESGIISSAVNDGLLEITANHVRTTPLGWRFLDEILQRFLPD
ncbi:radical SAM family heme chaperone HemW [Gammaproteobacteria bacterium]|nr:radical SAM family heme chaperone HemW [Gammaproteobacteria bacterium]